MTKYLALAALIVLSGCAHGQPNNCDGWRPVRLTNADLPHISDRLASDVLAHNEHGQRMCGWRP